MKNRSYFIPREQIYSFMNTKLALTLSMAGLLFWSLIAADLSSACSRILWNSNKQVVMVERSMDWSHPLGDRLVIYPRGMQMQGMPGKTQPATWLSKYGSIGVVLYGFTQSILKSLRGSVDPAALPDPLVNVNSEGINEKGLAAHTLFLNALNYGARDPQKPGVFTTECVRYVLDNFETLNDAVAGLQAIQIV
jgi:penicillin V acylase-like amidase (Ntn superfamily)